MLKLLGLGFLLMVNSAFAELGEKLMIMQGDFALSEDMSVSAIRRYEMVDGITKPGSTRLQELKNQGYACKQNTAVHWTCSKIIEPQSLTLELVARIKEKWSGLLISFRAPTKEPEQIQDDIGLQAWSVEQKVYVRTSFASEPKIWSQVSYLRSYTEKSSRWLLVFGDYRNDGATVINFLNEDTMGIQDIFDVSEGNVKLKYYVDLSIARIQ